MNGSYLYYPNTCTAVCPNGLNTYFYNKNVNIFFNNNKQVNGDQILIILVYLVMHTVLFVKITQQLNVHLVLHLHLKFLVKLFALLYVQMGIMETQEQQHVMHAALA